MEILQTLKEICQLSICHSKSRNVGEPQNFFDFSNRPLTWKKSLKIDLIYDLNALKNGNHQLHLKLDYLVVRFSREFSNPSIILLSHNDEVTFIKEIENRAHHHQYFLVVSFLSCQQSIKTSTNKRKRLFTEKKSVKIRRLPLMQTTVSVIWKLLKMPHF